jgi:hypothetical protein
MAIQPWFGGGGDELGAGQGIPKSWSAGINYSNKFNEDRQSLNGSYKYGKVITEGSGTPGLNRSCLIQYSITTRKPAVIPTGKGIRSTVHWTGCLTVLFQPRLLCVDTKEIPKQDHYLHTESLNAFGGM